MKRLILLTLAILMLVSCSPAGPLNVAVLKGPSGMGVVHTEFEGNLDILASPDEIIGKITSGEADVAVLPLNMASILYNKTEGQIRLLAVNTIGNLFMMGEPLDNISQLEGKKILSAGENASPMYVLELLLDGMDVQVEYLPSHADVVAAASEELADYYVVPEPFATVFKNKVGGEVALDLAASYEEKTGHPLTMGALVTTQEKLDEKKKAIEGFMVDYEASVKKVLAEPEISAQLIEEMGIVDQAALAQAAIPGAGLAFESPNDLKEAIGVYFELLMDKNPKSLGGEYPGEDFYSNY